MRFYRRRNNLNIIIIYQQRVGLAFFLQMAACFFHFIAFLIAMLAT